MPAGSLWGYLAGHCLQLQLNASWTYGIAPWNNASPAWVRRLHSGDEAAAVRRLIAPPAAAEKLRMLI